MTRLWEEIKRRNVVRVALAYFVVGWLILQLTDVLISLLSLPSWIGRAIFLFLLTGLPLVLVFAWAYELTPEGLKREREVDRSKSITHITGRKLDFIIIAVLGVALAIFAVERFILLPARSGDAGNRVELATDTHRSIAVLPFVNMSADPDNEYFSDGLSEEILNLLARIQNLKVIARTSSFAFKDKNEDVRTIGEALGVKTVLEGSVRKSGNRVRITAQLIQTTDGAHMWSETYDRTLTDIFTVQDDVAAAIIDALQLHVGNPDRGRPTQNTEAYTLFLRAKASYNVGEFQEAEATLRDAIAIDPGFAEAYESLASIYWYLGGVSITSEQGQRLMGEAAAKAIEIDPGLVFAQALYVAGNSEAYSYLKELQAFEWAVREEPGNAQLVDFLSYDLLQAGYLREGLEVADQYVELDPLSPVAHSRRADALVSMGRIDEALKVLDTSGQLGSDIAVELAAYLNLVWRGDESGIVQLEHSKNRPLVAWWSYLPELVAGARDPARGEAYLDRRIPEVLAALPEDDRFAAYQSLTALYLDFGFLDRYYELVFASDLRSSAWTDADLLIYVGTLDRRSGFTAHPKYLEVAELVGLTEVWDHRGPPDYCRKLDNRWVCE